MQEMLVQLLGWEDPLEESMATHSSVLAWRILWTEEPGGLWSMGSQRVGHDWATNTLKKKKTFLTIQLSSAKQLPSTVELEANGQRPPGKLSGLQKLGGCHCTSG